MNVGRYYLDHLHATAGAPELLLRGLERARIDLAEGEVDRFEARLARLRRSLRFPRGQVEVGAAVVRTLVKSVQLARLGDAEAAHAKLDPLVEACLNARPAQASAWA